MTEPHAESFHAAFAKLPASADTAVCFFAVAACATYVPLNPEYTEDEFDRYLVRLSA